MKQSLIFLILITTSFLSCGQNDNTPERVTNYVEKRDTPKLDESKIKVEAFSRDIYVHTEADYTDANGKGIIIENSYPRGGGLIYTAKGTQQYGHAVFWSRITNKTEKPLEITVNFPADSFQIYPSPDVHFKLLVPLDIMTPDKVTAFSFGFDSVAVFVESNFYEPSELKRTIPPNGESMFYVVLLSHLPNSAQGISRTGLFLDGEDFVYRLTSSLGVKLIPCGYSRFQE